MQSIPIEELLFKDPVVKGVDPKLMSLRKMHVSDFDFRAASERPGESREIKLDETFYGERYPGLPQGASFALARAGEGMKAKQIRSEWKKAQKKLAISSGHKILSFD